MKRGDLYRVYRGSKNDPKDYRVFLIVSRQLLVDSKFSTVICAPVYSKYDSFPTQVEVGPNEGLKHDSAIYCDELVSLSKSLLTDYIVSVHKVGYVANRPCIFSPKGYENASFKVVRP